MCLFIFNFLPFLCLFSSIMPYFYVTFYGMVNTTGISLLNCFSSDDSAFIPFAVATTEELLLLQAHFQLSMRYEIRTKMILEAEPCFLLFLSRACSGFFFFFTSHKIITGISSPLHPYTWAFPQVSHKVPWNLGWQSKLAMTVTRINSSF